MEINWRRLGENFIRNASIEGQKSFGIRQEFRKEKIFIQEEGRYGIFLMKYNFQTKQYEVVRLLSYIK